MCDFAADAEAAGILVGRKLTLERVRQLNAKDYFYQMLKDNPDILKIYPGIEDELLENAIDCHVHAYPDFVHRAQDMIGVSVDAARAGMRAVAFKDHFNVSANAAYLAQLHVNKMVELGELERGINVYGGAGTCHGMNIEYITQAVKYPNFKMIWFPTFTSKGFWRGAGFPDHEGVALVEDGEVLPDVVRIMEIAAENHIGIGFGHTDFQELLPLAKKAQELGVRATLDHPLLELNKLLIEEMQEIASYGVFVGTYCQPMIPSLYQPVADPMDTITTIKTIGPDKCIIGSDFGQVMHVNTVDGMRIFIRALLGFGVEPEEISLMLKDNPAKLMYLDEPAPVPGVYRTLN